MLFASAIGGFAQPGDATPVDSQRFDGYFEANDSGLKGDQSFLALSSAEQFDKFFGEAPIPGATFLPDNVYDTKLVVAAIKRGALRRYGAVKVSTKNGKLFVAFAATDDAANSAVFSTPLILAVAQGNYQEIIFFENGRQTGTLPLTKTLTIPDAAKIIPIVEMSVGGIIGGVQDGKWIKDKQTAATLKGQDEYVLVGLKGVEEGGVTLGSKPSAEVPCEQFYQVDLEMKMDSGVAVGSNAKWNFTPRVPQAISLTDAAYKKIVGDVVRSKGIAKPNVKIKQAYRVDLDGDGTEEVILSASHFKTGAVSPSAAVGDYSFVMLRKVVNGKAQNIMLAGEFIKKAIKFGAPNEYGLSSIADLNGDGKMEIVMKSRYYEGASSVVYEINGVKATEVLSTGCGV